MFVRALVLVSALIATAVCGWCGPAILNGGFELNVLGSPFVGDATTVPDWSHIGGGDGPHWAVGYSDIGGSITTAGEGNQFVTMGGGGSVDTGGWSQSVGGFTIGQAY